MSHPIKKIRVGLVTVSIWENLHQKGAFYNATFDRAYKDGDTWKSTQTFGADDLLALAKAADLAHTDILARQTKA